MPRNEQFGGLAQVPPDEPSTLIPLTICQAGCYKSAVAFLFGGAVAQLGARLDGIEEVAGSNPAGSTKFFLITLRPELDVGHAAGSATMTRLWPK
jgi:hypothetical protein